MIALRRTLFVFLATVGFLLLPLPSFGQVYVAPTELYLYPGEPSCGTLWADYAPGYVEIYVPSGGPYYWWVDNYQTDFCVDSWEPGTYTITGFLYLGEYYISAYAQFTVYAGPPPPPPPVIYDAGAGCDNWDCIWATGANFHPDSRVEVRTTNGAYQETYYGPAFQMSPPLVVNETGDWLALQLNDPNIRSSFGWNGLDFRVVNNDGTASGWRRVYVAAPTISSGGPTCSDFYCVQLNGSFPLSAYVDFRIPGQSEILPDAYTDLVVTASQITLRLNPNARYAYDTTGLNAWVVNPSVANWSSAYYLAPLDRSVIGPIDGIWPVGQQYYIWGWTCAKTQPTSIGIEVYVGGPAGAGGTLMYSGTANQPSEPGVAEACNSSGSNYRFAVPIPHTVTQYYGGQPIYVYGISPLGYGNALLNASGQVYVPSVDRSITGWIEGISQQGQNYFLYGWACAKTYPGSIDVHVYVGGAAGGGGTFAFSGTANLASDGGIAAACDSTGSNYRFSLQIPQSVHDQYGGQPLFVHGISPFGLPNELLNNSGTFTVPVIDRSITGWFSGISTQGQDYYIYGWACAKTYAGSVDVQAYVGGPAGGGGTLAFSGTANQPSEPAVAAACNSTGSNYRFSLQIPPGVIQQYGGQPIYVHGISPFGLPNLLLNGSGNFSVPGTQPVSLKEYIYLGDRVIAVETTTP